MPITLGEDILSIRENCVRDAFRELTSIAAHIPDSGLFQDICASVIEAGNLFAQQSGYMQDLTHNMSLLAGLGPLGARSLDAKVDPLQTLPTTMNTLNQLARNSLGVLGCKPVVEKLATASQLITRAAQQAHPYYNIAR